MNKQILKSLKIYGIFLCILAVVAIFYSLMLSKDVVNTNETNINIISFIIGALTFLILGFLSGNARGKKGLMTGIAYSLILILFIILFSVLGLGTFNFKSIIKLFSYVLCSGIGGILGVNIRQFM